MSTLSVSGGIVPKLSQTNHNEAVLVTAPSCVPSSDQLDSTLVQVERESYQNVDVSEYCGNPLYRIFESGFSSAAVCPTEEPTELNEIVHNNNNNDNNSRSDKIPSIEGYDECQEYRCCNVEEEECYKIGDDLYEHNDRLEIADKCSFLVHGKPNSCVSETERKRTSMLGPDLIYILGKKYHSVFDYSARRDVESSLFWFTYRCDFPSIDPYGITSDAGWGCMLRASQMLLAQALRLHYRGRDWYPPTAQAGKTLSFRQSDPFIRSLLTWFADFPSSNQVNSSDSMYSLHNMVAVGQAKYDKLPGEWYGPGTACYVLRDLVQRHENQQQQASYHQLKITSTASMSTASRKMFRVHVASSEGAVYTHEIHKMMTRDAKLIEEKDQTQESPKDKIEAMKVPQTHPLEDVTWEDELIDSAAFKPKPELIKWDTSLLLLIPLRLGLRNFNADYVEPVAHIFSLPQSVGVLGGRPRGARWFYGAQVSGSTPRQIYGLDPHTVQTAPRRRNALVNGISKQVVELTDEYLRSVHTTYTETLPLEKMDPSIALGFYIRDHADLESLFENLKEWRKVHPKAPELFHVQDVIREYENDDLLMMNEDHNEDPSMALESNFNRDDQVDSSDDDEYVML